MAGIKTALELALERTESLKADKAGMEEAEARKAGKRIAARAMDGSDGGEDAGFDPKKELAALGKGKDAARAGYVEAVLTYVQLPRDREAKMPSEKIVAALAPIVGGLGGDKKVASYLQQVKQFCARYLEDLDRVEESLKRQFASRLKQKEDEIARRTGQRVEIDPRRDPEYASLLQKSANQLKGQYQDALTGAKEELKALIG